MNKQCGKVKHYCAYCQKYFKIFLGSTYTNRRFSSTARGKSLHRHTLLGEGIGHERTREQILCVLEVTHLQLTHF